MLLILLLLLLILQGRLGSKVLLLALLDDPVLADLLRAGPAAGDVLLHAAADLLVHLLAAAGLLLQLAAAGQLLHRLLLQLELALLAVLAHLTAGNLCLHDAGVLPGLLVRLAACDGVTLGVFLVRALTAHHAASQLLLLRQLAIHGCSLHVSSVRSGLGRSCRQPVSARTVA